jgi:ABC-type glycerol-3-phosphate transport system substrate-binding protein
MIFDGRVYGFATNASADAVWINKDIFDACGVPYPSGPMKWEEFLPLAQKLTVRDEDGKVIHYGFLCDWAYQWQHFIAQWGASVYSEDGTRCTTDSPEFIAAIQFMYDLIYKYKVQPSPLGESSMATQGGWGTGNITWFGGGRAAMALGGRWWLCILRDYENLRLGAFESPHQYHRVFRGGGKSTLINRKSPYREDAFNFLLYMHGREYNELINHQADALCPVKKYCYTEEFLHDPEYPEEDFNHVWREAMAHAVPDPSSPFINGNTAFRIITKQLDLVKNNQKTPEQAMKRAAHLINREILKSVKRDPSLRKRYEKLTGRKVL